MILRPVRPASPSGPPITNRPVGLTRYVVFASSHFVGHDFLNDKFDQRLADFFLLYVSRVLRRNDHCCGSHRFSPSYSIETCDFASGRSHGTSPDFANARQLASEFMGKHDRRWH